MPARVVLKTIYCLLLALLDHLIKLSNYVVKHIRRLTVHYQSSNAMNKEEKKINNRRKGKLEKKGEKTVANL